jgi:hypothetical protein
MKQININNPFCKNIEFLKDKYKFSLIGHNLDVDNNVIYSDEKNYIFVIGMKHKPVWLWTKNDISKEKSLEIKQGIDIINSIDFNFIACKENFYKELLMEDNEFQFNELSGCYVCEELIKPKKCDGRIRLVTEEDRNVITQLWYDDCVEADPDNHISYELAQKFTDRFLLSGSFYVWENDDGKIVSIIDYTVVDNVAEVAHAYTIPNERGKGYMANSVYELTKIILSKGLLPVLSTDYNYLPSNKCYSNIGYQLKDKMVIFSNNKVLKKEDSKTK